MAAPNLANVTSIIGKTAYAIPTNLTENIIVANPAGSGKVLKINSVMATNVDGISAYDASVGINTLANGGGTTYKFVAAVPVPADASLIVTDKSMGFYLEEDKSVVIQVSTANKISFTVSYEELS